MAKSKDYPQKIRPYVFHGLDLGMPDNNEWGGDCVFCGRGEKFSINENTGKWRCWKCGEHGNVYTFIQKFHALSMEATQIESYKQLANDLNLLDAQSLVEWQLAISPYTGDWLIPGYNPDGKLLTLYRYIKQPQGGYRCIPTPTLGHRIHGVNLWDSSKPIVYICEGFKDGLALWEVLGRTKTCEERGYAPTASREHSLLGQANVIAVPGCEVFFDHWTPMFSGKSVYLLYDSDHPRKHPKTGHISPGAGWQAMERVTTLFSEAKEPPEELNCIHWGEDGYDQTIKSGFDLRDLITKE